MQDFKRMTKTKAFKNTIFFVILVSLILGASGALSYVSMQDEHLIQSRNKSMIEIQRQPENSLDVIVVGDILYLWTVGAIGAGDVFDAGNSI